MITVVPTDRIYLCCGATDMRRGINSLARIVQQVLSLDPHTGAIFCFRGRKAQLPTFCIQFSFCDDCISLASAVREQGTGLAVSARQESDVDLYG